MTCLCVPYRLVNCNYQPLFDIMCKNMCRQLNTRDIKAYIGLYSVVFLRNKRTYWIQKICKCEHRLQVLLLFPQCNVFQKCQILSILSTFFVNKTRYPPYRPSIFPLCFLFTREIHIFNSKNSFVC